MSKERKNINDALKEADMKLATFLMPRLSTEDYHEAIELANVIVDLSVHAFGLAVDANREAFGVKIDQDITPKALPKLGEGEERD